MEPEFVPWMTPLCARLFQGPFLVGGVLVYAEDEDACRVCRRVSLECFYGLRGVQEVSDASET